MFSFEVFCSPLLLNENNLSLKKINNNELNVTISQKIPGSYVGWFMDCEH